MPYEIKVIRKDGTEELHTCDHLNYTTVLQGSEPTRRTVFTDLPRLRPGVHITAFTEAGPGEKQSSREIVLDQDGEVAYVVNAKTRQNAKVLSWPPRERSVSAPATASDSAAKGA